MSFLVLVLACGLGALLWFVVLGKSMPRPHSWPILLRFVPSLAFSAILISYFLVDRGVLGFSTGESGEYMYGLFVLFLLPLAGILILLQFAILLGVRANRRAGLLGLLVLLSLSLSLQSAASTCEGGRFRVDDGIDLGGLGSGMDVVVVAGRSVSFGVCGEATKSRVRSKRSKLFVKASWQGCEAVPGKLRLRMQTSRGCESAKGFFRQKRGEGRVKFTATRGCEYVVDCSPNYVPVDTDGDQCKDSCEELTLECRDDSDCWDNYLFCGKATGECGGAGECRPRSEFCTYGYDPVCGCNGESYGNACRAGSAGVNIAYAGECEVCARVICTPGTFPVDTDGDGCEEACESAGNRCRTDEQCVDGYQFCSKREGRCEGRGRCRNLSEMCTREYLPVCGCDGQTYSNRCTAAAAGVSISAEGSCE